MGYKEFKEEMLSALKEQHGGEADMELQTIMKANGVCYDGVRILPRGMNAAGRAASVFRLDLPYKAYAGGGMDIGGCVDAIWEEYVSGRRRDGDVQKFLRDIRDWKYVRDNVYPMLLSQGENRELLKGLVVIPMLDLAIIFIVRGVSGDAYCSIKFRKGMLGYYGISRKELYEAAMGNMEKDGYRFRDIKEIGDSSPAREGITGEIPECCRMRILSNRNNIYGAAGFLNRKLIKEFAKGRDMYILPSSLHELIFVPADGRDNEKAALDRMVMEINELEVAEEERLADHCYFYDAEKDEIRMEP